MLFSRKASAIVVNRYNSQGWPDSPRLVLSKQVAPVDKKSRSSLKNFESNFRRLTVSYSLVQIVFTMGYCTIYVLAGIFLLSRGFSNSQVGVTITIANAVSLLSQPVVAAAADKSKKLSLQSITALMLLAEILIALALLFLPPVVLPTSILFILLVSLFIPQVSLVTSMSIEHINSGVPLNYSLARGIGSFAFAILSLLMGFLVETFGTETVMIADIVRCLLGILLVLTFPRAKSKHSTSGNVESAASGLFEFAVKNKRFIAVVISSAILFMSHSFINTFTIQIVRHIGGDSSDMGVAVAVAGFVELPAMALFPLIYKKIRNPGTIMKLSGAFFVIKAVITLAAPNMLWINVAQCLQFFTYAMFLPASVYYVNHVVREADKVKGQALMGMSWGISGMLGGVLGGFMLDARGGVNLMLTMGVVISAAGLLLLTFIDNYRLKPARDI